MADFYPHISDKIKRTAGICSSCKQPSASRFKVEIRVSWFRGDDEVEHLCPGCLTVLEKSIQQERDNFYAQEARANEKEDKFMQRLYSGVAKLYKVRKLTEYQWRVEGVLDIYPVNKRYHDIKQNKRGDYRDVYGVLKFFFSKNPLTPKI